MLPTVTDPNHSFSIRQVEIGLSSDQDADAEMMDVDVPEAEDVDKESGRDSQRGQRRHDVHGADVSLSWVCGSLTGDHLSFFDWALYANSSSDNLLSVH